jgi:hypothetical protein
VCPTVVAVAVSLCSLTMTKITKKAYVEKRRKKTKPPNDREEEKEK